MVEGGQRPLSLKHPLEESILIRGARVHNLKNVSLAIPHNQLTVVTGVSGSGKSSLVFDTIYAEGQRRYVESLSAYARQFLERMEKPDVDEIYGIAPPIAIRQKNTTRNPRSTVATSTEIYDFLRLLYARVGPHLLSEMRRASDSATPSIRWRSGCWPSQQGSRWYALFPVRGGPTTEALRDHLFELRKKGFNRLYQNGPRLRILHARIAARHRFQRARLHPGGPLRHRARSAPAHRRHHGNLLSRIRRSHLRGSHCREPAARHAPLQREVRLQALRHRVRDARAQPVQLQQSHGRLPALPGLRQHHRLRHGPGHSQRGSFARRRRRRSLDQAAVLLVWPGTSEEARAWQGPLGTCPSPT